MWPPWGNHKGCPYDAPPQRDFFTPSKPWETKPKRPSSPARGGRTRQSSASEPYYFAPLGLPRTRGPPGPRAGEAVKKSGCRGGPCGRPGATTRVAPTTRRHNAIFSHLLAPWAKIFRPSGPFPSALNTLGNTLQATRFMKPHFCVAHATCMAALTERAMEHRIPSHFSEWLSPPLERGFPCDFTTRTSRCHDRRRGDDHE